MATKTIAVDAEVYRKLAGRKRESESFTKLLGRLADADNGHGTCADAVREAFDPRTREATPSARPAGT